MPETAPSHSLESTLVEVVCQTISKTEQCHQLDENSMNHQEAAAVDGCSIANGKMSEQIGENLSPLPSVGVEVPMCGHSGQTFEPSLKIDSVGSECARISLADHIDVLSNCDGSLGPSEVVNPRQITEENLPEACLQGREDADNVPPLSEDVNGGLNHGQTLDELLSDSVLIGVSSGTVKENDIDGHGHLTSEAENPHMMVTEHDPSDQVKVYSSLDKLEGSASSKPDKDAVNPNSIQHDNAYADGTPDLITKGSSKELPSSGEGILGNENKVIEGSVASSENDPTLQSQPSVQDGKMESILDQVGTPQDNMLKDSDTCNQVEAVKQSADIDRSGQQCGEIHATPSYKSGAKAESSVSNQRGNSQTSRQGCKTTPKTLVKREYTLRSSGSTRAQKSNSKDNDDAPESARNVDNATNKKRKKKKSQIQKKPHDEFDKMRKQLKYWLHRITVEQSLIDAYSSEGWRGQSLEKLRPEMEIQRAKKDINRSKLSIRGLFQRIVAVSAEGRFPDSLFDSDGLLDSEDIYCAKCGTKEVASGNDIILCDGPCDRGYHQFCLEPPLQTEDIPPGDEGWLCPACDCKIDCIGVLNDSMGLKLSIDDSWEKVFPEAEKTTGSSQGDGLELPSDDSDDTDFDPNGVNDDDDDNDPANVTDDAEGSNSSSDESSFSSASEDLAALNNNDQYAGLPSDDSEDEDFDPTNPDADNQAKQEGSSSEFTSASENLVSAGGGDDDCEDEDEDEDKNCTVDGPPVLSPEGDDVMPLSGKRKIERLDYKKLYDETYANTSSSSSDDEEWKDAVEPKKKDSEEEYSDASNRTGCGKRTRKNKQEQNVARPKRRKSASQECASKVISDDGVSNNLAKSRHNTPRKSRKLEGFNEQLSPSSKSSPVSGHGRRGKKLEEAVTQRLYSFFKENHYPERSIKENIAAELGLTYKQVDKWFGNARWSFSQSPGKEAANSQPGSKRKVGRPRKIVTESPSQLPSKIGTKSPNRKEVKVSTQTPTKSPKPKEVKVSTQTPTKSPNRKEVKVATQTPTKSATRKGGRVSTRTPTKASKATQQNRGTHARNNKLEVGESSVQETLSPESEREKSSLECLEVVQALTSEGNKEHPNGTRRSRRRSRA